MTSSPTHSCIYRIDTSDRVADVDAGFYAFALENACPELTEASVVGRSVWDFVSGVEVRTLYEVLFRRVRAGAAVKNLRFRCDTPDLRRFMELTLRLLPDEKIEVESKLVRKEPRDWIRLFDLAAPRGDDFITLCSICKRVQLEEDRWVDVEDAVREKNLFAPIAMPALAYAVCPACHRRALDLSG